MEPDTDGDILPPFANEAAQTKFANLKELRGKLESLGNKEFELQHRIQQMQKHSGNVVEEIRNAQQMVEFKQGDFERKKHEQTLRLREAGILKADIVKDAKEQLVLTDMMNAAQKEIYSANDRLDQFKLQMNWNQTELDQWALAKRQKEDDEAALRQYTKADEGKVKELRATIKQLTANRVANRQRLAEVTTDAQSVQIELDKLAQQLREAASGRAREIAQWEESVKMIKVNDDELERLGDDYVAAVARKKAQETRTAELVSFKALLARENSRKETQLTLTDRQLAKLRTDATKSRADLTEFQDELQVVKAEIAQSATAQGNKRSALATAKALTETRRTQLAEAQKRLEAHVSRMEAVKSGKMSKEREAAEAEILLAEQVKLAGEREKEKKVAKDILFRESQELMNERESEAAMLGEISGVQSAAKNIHAHVRKLDLERQRQQELLYSVDFECQLVQRRLSRLSGERTLDEKEELNRKISEAEAQLKDVAATHALLTTQCKRQETESKNIKMQFALSEKVCRDLEDVVTELETQNSNIAREDVAVTRTRDELATQKDGLILEANKIRDALAVQMDKFFTTRNTLSQMSLAMEERKQKLDAHEEGIRAANRLLQEQKHILSLRASEGKQKVGHLETKFSILTKKRSFGGESSGGESQAYYVLKAVQEREELQRKGDELDVQLKLAEKELVAVENAFDNLTEGNRSYSAHLRGSENKLDNGKPEDLNALDDQLRHTIQVLQRKKSRLAELDRQKEDDERRLLQTSQHYDQLSSHQGALSSVSSSLDREIDEALDRSHGGTELLAAAREKPVPANLDGPILQALNLDVANAAQREANKAVLTALGNLCRVNQPMETFVKQKLLSKGYEIK